MLLVGSIVLGGGALCLGLALSRRGEAASIFMGIAAALYSFGHPVLIEDDLKRRGVHAVGCLSLIAVCLAPPVGACLYLISAYRAKAVVLIPLYIGLLSSSMLLGWGLGEVLRAAR